MKAGAVLQEVLLLKFPFISLTTRVQ